MDLTLIFLIFDRGEPRVIRVTEARSDLLSRTLMPHGDLILVTPLR